MTDTTAFAANTSGSIISVVVAGTVVTLPDSQVLPAGITANGTNDTFTVGVAGRYRLSYQVNTTAALIMGTRLLINGTANTASTVLPILSLSNFSNEILLDITAGTTVSLQLFGLLGTAVLLGSSAGASLMIMRLS